MYKVTSELLQYMADNLQVGERSPNYNINIYKKSGNMQYELVPYNLNNAISIDIDNRWNMAADEVNVVLQNINGFYSPDYSHLKKYQNIEELPPSGYAGLILPYNKIEIDLGYNSELRRKFTGYIQPIEISEENPTININALNEYRKLLKPIDPIVTKTLIYKGQKATDIIIDLCLRAGTRNVIIDMDTVGGFDYSINQVTFELGTTYTDAINLILSTMGHRIFANREGYIQIKKLESYTQLDNNIWTFTDYLNVTSGNYKIDPTIIRNRIIIQSKNSWKAFEDPFLIDYCNGERISTGIEVPWAETDEQKLAVANGLFLQMRRKLRRITIATVGNPSVDIGDLTRLELLTSTANAKYMITGIRSTFSESGYFDILDLEFVTGGDLQFAVPAAGNYITSETDALPEKRQSIINFAIKYLGILYQNNGDKYHNTADYGFDSTRFIFAVMDQVGLYSTYKNLIELTQWTQFITKEELQVGDLIYYKNDLDEINHVVIYLGDEKVIGAIGGNSTITTQGAAQKIGAIVKIQPIDYNGRPQAYGRVII